MSHRGTLTLSMGALSVIVFAIALAGCGGGGDSTTASTSPSNPKDVSGKITVWDLAYGSFPGYEDAADKLDQEFERKYPNVTVDHVAQPYETYNQAYKAAFVANEGPDVMMMTAGVRGVLGYQKGLEVLNDRITPEMQEKIYGWEAVTPGNEIEGEHYGVPIALNAQVFYYNKEMFEKAGLPREFKPKTWDEVKEAGEKLKAAGLPAFNGGNKEGFENYGWFAAGWQTVNTPEQSVELSEGEMSFTDQAVADAFGPIMMLEEAGLYPQEVFTTPLYPDGSAALGKEKGAMQLGNLSLVTFYNEYIPSLGVENVGMFFPPGSKYIGTEPQWVWSIPKFAEDKDAAWAYIDYMSSQEGIQTLVDNLSGELPNRTDVELPANSKPQAYAGLEELRKEPTFLIPHMMVPSAALEVMTSEISQVLQGRTSLEDAQQAMQEAAEKSAG